MVKKIFAQGYLYIILLLMYAPLLLLFLFSFTESVAIGEWTGFTFKLYGRIFTGRYSTQIGEALLNTLLIGLASSLLALVLGTLGAIGVHNMNSRNRQLISTTGKITMINAEIITAFCFMLLFAMIGMRRGYLTVILAHTTFCTPYVLLSVLPKLKQMNKNTYEAAIDLGATPIQAMTKVIIPEILPGMISGFILAFTISIDDFVITQFTIGEFDTLSTFIYNAAGGKRPLPAELRALSVIIFITVLAILFVVNRRASNNKSQSK